VRDAMAMAGVAKRHENGFAWTKREESLLP
jgi:hypothetical protein